MSLVQLIRGIGAPDKFATATPATSATSTAENSRSVATVATVAVAELTTEIVGPFAPLNHVAEWTRLEAAINACCTARHDSEENRAALLADCRDEPVTKWCWLSDYFNGEAALWK